MTTPTQLTLAEAIRIAVLRTGLPLADVADRIGVHEKTVGRWQRGTTMPQFNHVVALADLTETPLDFFAATVR